MFAKPRVGSLAGHCQAQKAEQAAAGPGKQQVPQKFRRRTLDPDERYAAERAANEAAQAQRAAQERARKQRRAVRDMLRPREVHRTRLTCFLYTLSSALLRRRGSPPLHRCLGVLPPSSRLGMLLSDPLTFAPAI